MPVRSLLLALAVGALLVARFHWLSLTNVNWDEFHFLSRVHEHLRGELPTPFQTFHVHLFGWLASFGSEVDQIVAARHAMFVLTVGTWAGVWLVTRRLAGATAAWFAVFAGLAVMYGLRHGESFRADPMLAFLFIAGAALLALRPARPMSAAIAGALWACATLISVKALIYLPTLVILLGTAWLSTSTARARVASVGAFAVTSTVSYIVLSWWHAGTSVNAAATSSAQGVAAAAQGMWLQPRWDVLIGTLRHDWGFWTLAVAGALVATRAVYRAHPEARRHALVALAMAVPVGSVVFYRNGFEYFYVALVPGVSVLCGIAFARIAASLARRPAIAPIALAALALPSLVVAVSYFALNRADATQTQREVLAAIHAMFPTPVAYLDRCGMVSGFPKVGPLLSTYVLSRYRARGVPVMAGLVAQRQPLFVLANVRGLDLSRSWAEQVQWEHRLLREDFEYLQANYVHHWGPIWVAGKSIELSAGTEHPFLLAVSGRYTVESDASVIIDGAVRHPGEVVDLTAGEHTVAGGDRLVLRYGDGLHRPTHPLGKSPIFMGL